MTNLTQKEKMLLSDQKKHEQVCIQKYQNYANQAQDSQLKQLFTSLAQQEQQHLDTINQIMSGQVPSMGQGQQSGQNQQSSMQSSTQSSEQGSTQSSAQSSAQSSSLSDLRSQDEMNFGSSAQSQGQSQSRQSQQYQSQQSQSSTSSSASQNDAAICNDMLMTEKYVSGAYDSAIFEFTDANVRQTLNHIQKEEQQHGEKIFNYMQSNGMYNVQS